jgi:pilus assembly protein CpaB
MKIRIIGAIIAVVLAAVGALTLVLYVRDADVRANDGAALVSVWVVKDAGIPKGTPGEQVGSLVEVRQLPKSAVQKGRVTDLNDLSGLVASADLLAGEQLVAGRFKDPAVIAAHGDVTVPTGMQEITIALPVDQAVGGVLVAGSTVGVLISETDPLAGPSTKFVLHKVLVTRVQAGSQYLASADANAKAKQDPVSTIMVTLALKTPDVERVAWAAELQKNNSAGIWLTLEPATADENGSKVVDTGNVFE